MINRTEQDIIKNWVSIENPIASISCITFNHENYIAEAIDGFLMQETDFPFEILIHDDASTDRTADIIREYEAKYPKLIKPIYQKENQYSQGINPGIICTFPRARGQFIAFCEGDDFWNTPYKLQKQVDLLQKYPEAVMSVAKSNVCKQEGDSLILVNTYEGNEKVIQGFEEITRSYFHTSTYVIRRQLLNEVISKYFSGHCLFGDTALRSILVSYGPFVFLPEVVSVYRQTGNGIWTSLSREKQLQWEIDAAEKLASMLDGLHKKYQHERLYGLYRAKFFAALKAGHAVVGIRLLPSVLRYGVKKIPLYLKRLLKRLEQK
jgi:glycosyltransferase involved in cell wall biosynthesis